jgi:hypothetical protein
LQLRLNSCFARREAIRATFCEIRVNSVYKSFDTKLVERTKEGNREDTLQIPPTSTLYSDFAWKLLRETEKIFSISLSHQHYTRISPRTLLYTSQPRCEAANIPVGSSSRFLKCSWKTQTARKRASQSQSSFHPTFRSLGREKIEL